MVGCTANLTWDDTLESIENFEIVKSIVREHPQAYILRSVADLDRPEHRGKVGVLLGLQNPKALSDSLGLLDAFFDLGLRCLSSPSAKTATTVAAMPARSTAVSRRSVVKPSSA